MGHFILITIPFIAPYIGINANDLPELFMLIIQIVTDNRGIEYLFHHETSIQFMTSDESEAKEMPNESRMFQKTTPCFIYELKVHHLLYQMI